MIATERLTAYQRWELHDFGGPASAAPDHVPEAAPEPATSADIIQLPTAAEIERIYAQAHKDGYAAGYEEGTARVRMEAMQLHTLVENLDQALGNLDQQVAEELLTLALEVARQVVRQALAVTPEAILATVREALLQLSQQQAVIFVHPNDAALVREILGEQMSHAGHRLLEDAALERGGCRVEAAGTQIDATLETRWKRVVESLGARSDWLDTTSR